MRCHFVRERLLQQRRLRHDRDRQRLRRLWRAVCLLFERPAVHRHQLRVRRDLLPERLLRYQQTLPDVDELHL